MKPVKVYTKNYCPFCHAVKDYLSSQGIKFEEIDLSNDEAAFSELKEKTGMRTIPQVFIGDELIGGHDQTVALGEKGQLQELINT